MKGKSHGDESFDPAIDSIKGVKAVGAEWRIVGAKVKGRAHAAGSVPCQDAVSWWADENAFILALGDGAGSAAHSELGSQTAVDAAVESFIALREEGVGKVADPTTLARSARSAVEKLARAHELPLCEFATTLALAVNWGDGRVTTAQVGDGIVAVEVDEIIREAAPPLQGEFANEAVFLTSGRTVPEFTHQEFEIESLRGIALSSDGLYLVATSEGRDRSPFVPFFVDAFTAVRDGATDCDIECFLAKVEERTGDDKSLLIAVSLMSAPPTEQ